MIDLADLLTYALVGGVIGFLVYALFVIADRRPE